MGGRGPGIVLIGLRRAGKSTVGPMLARGLGMRFLDLDRVVEAREGAPPSVLLAQAGEAAFRKSEWRALRALLERSPGAVLAAGGGTPELPASAGLLAAYGRIVYLSVPADEIVRRAATDRNPGERPLLAGADPVEEAAVLLARRDPLFRSLADYVVEASGSADEVVARCVRVLGTG